VDVTAWLIDKSALVRLHKAADPTEWTSRIDRGLLRISTVTRLEVGYSARTGIDHRMLLTEPPISSMPVEFLTPKIEDRAVEMQLALAERGHHRAPSIPNLLIAATAELTDLILLHLDKDFDLIAELTGQATERLQLS
jgi:predicted nucleic acid-binding protein